MDDAVKSLLAGEEGTNVVDLLRARYQTPKSLSSVVSLVRKRVLQTQCFREELQPFAHIPEILKFMTSTLSEQLSIVKQHEIERDWPQEAEDILCLLKMPCLETFRITEEEATICKKESGTAQMIKNETPITVNRTSDVVENIAYNLHNAQQINGMLLACCLLAASGRRLAEVMNGRSLFTPVDAHHVIFKGQLKKKGFSEPYEIPLLVNSKLFVDAYNILHSRISSSVHLTNNQVTAKHQGNLTRQLKVSFPMFHHIHMLRSFYIAFVYETFDVPTTFAKCAMMCLGHESLNESLSYNDVKVQDFERHKGIMGPLQSSGSTC